MGARRGWNDLCIVICLKPRLGNSDLGPSDTGVSEIIDSSLVKVVSWLYLDHFWSKWQREAWA